VLIRRETNSEKSGFTELKNKDGYQDGASLFSPFQTAAGRPTFFGVVKQTLEKKHRTESRTKNIQTLL
jgi:hypothetical protein